MKEIGKKLFVTALIGTITLVAIYYKDKYLEDENDSAEALSEIVISNEDQNTKKEKEHQKELMIQKEKEHQKELMIQKEKELKKNTPKEQTFNEFKKSMNFKNYQNNAFDELDAELNK